MSSRHQRDAFYDTETSASHHYRNSSRSNGKGSSPYGSGDGINLSSRRHHGLYPTMVGDLRNPMSNQEQPLPPTPFRSTFAMMRDQELSQARLGRSQPVGGLSPNRQPYRSTFDYSSSLPRRQYSGGLGAPPLINERLMSLGTRGPKLTDEQVSPTGDPLEAALVEDLISGGMMEDLGQEAGYYMDSRSSHSFGDQDLPSVFPSETSSDTMGVDSCYVYSPCKKTRPKIAPVYVPHNVTSDHDSDKKPSALPSVTAVRYKTPLKDPPNAQGDDDHSHSMIQVSPGQFVRLHGADETWKAIQRDHYQPCMCLVCDIPLFCTLDARLVICPDCKSISPLDFVDSKTSSPESDCCGGAGLGFKAEALVDWQASILRDYYGNEN